MEDPFSLLTAEAKSNKVWWRVAQAYFDAHTFTDHQLDSYNILMHERLSDIITGMDLEYTKVKVKYVVSFDNVYIDIPKFTEQSGITKKLYPQDCRIRNLTYTNKVYADVTRYTLDNENRAVETKLFANVFIGAMPCMVLSETCNLHGKDIQGRIKKGECYKDPGGYFIINGIEKVLMSQDRMAHNEIFVFKSKRETIKLPIADSEKNRSLPCDWYAEVRSYSRTIEPNISTTYLKLSTELLDKGEDSRLYIEIPGLKSPVPWPILFMAFGVTNSEEMISYVCAKDDIQMIALLTPSLECHPIESQEDALNYLSKFVITTQKGQRMIQLKRILREKLFQNIEEIYMKKYYLGHMTAKLLTVALGRCKQDDRDHYARKRVVTAGSLIHDLFKSIWKRVLREVKNHLEKKRTNDLAQILYSKFTNYIKPPFATGNWIATKSSNKASKAGISQLLNRHNYLATLSNLRRVTTPSDKNSKIVKPRECHSSQWSFICPAETPEGGGTGLIKNLSMLTIVSIGSSEEPIMDWLRMTKQVDMLSNIDGQHIQSKIKVFINGSWVAITSHPEELINKLRSLRRNGKIEHQVSISQVKEGIRIYTDEGRLLTPFLIVENGQLVSFPNENPTWNELVDNNVVEYLDPAEFETIYHSVYPWKLEKDHTHALIHPSFIFGVSASTIIGSSHNQFPRNIFQSSMGKQALGIYSLNFLHRYDTSAHILSYPQIPIVNTQAMRLLGTDKFPSGQNLVVAIMSAGFNQEDSIILNRQSIDNGMFRSINYTTYCESNRRKGTTTDEIRLPEKLTVKETLLKGYKRLDSDGISKENTPIAKRDVVIGKVTSSNHNVKDISSVIKKNGMEEDSVIDLSTEIEKIYACNNGASVIDRAILTLNEDSYRTNKIRVRQTRIPQIGDKGASRAAQKGIVGMIYPPEDMPYSTKTGISPDVIMNPNAIPSRMTIAQLLESVFGKGCSLRGVHGDFTPFEENFSEKVIADELEKYGFERYGDETMIDGMTGEEIECHIFIGITFYQRLKHMVDDKIHARNQDGPRETLTRQPVEGRKRDGGFRMGEMETWCGISHGAANFLIDRLVNNSDGYEMYVCDHCGNVAIASVKKHQFQCKHCEQNTDISKVRVPYAYKLLSQELQAMLFGMWINVDTTKTLIQATTPSH